jgi:hypothetical protein
MAIYEMASTHIHGIFLVAAGTLSCIPSAEDRRIGFRQFSPGRL